VSEADINYTEFSLGEVVIWTTLTKSFISVLERDDPNLPPLLYALFSFARGLGSIASGPLFSALLSSGGLHGTGGYGVKRYGALILWTGAGMVLSGSGARYKGFKRDWLKTDVEQ